MIDSIGSVLAVIVSFALFVVGGWFFFRKPTGDDEQPVEHTVERVRTTSGAIAFIKRALAPGSGRRDQDDSPDDDQDGGQSKRDDTSIGEPLQPTEPSPGEQVLVERTRPHTPPPSPAHPALERPGPSMTVTAVVDRPAAPSAIAAPQADDRPALAPPVELEGIDMSQAPLVPAGDGTNLPLPTVPQLQEALATGGFDRFMAWLRAFLRASGLLASDAQALHEDAMRLAARARNKYVLALQAFQAVQADGLDTRTVTRMWEALAQAEQEATAAALATHATAQAVVACGGGQPTVAAVISALDYGHGDVARAVRSAPVRVVRRITFYEN